MKLKRAMSRGFLKSAYRQYKKSFKLAKAKKKIPEGAKAATFNEWSKQIEELSKRATRAPENEGLTEEELSWED